MEADPSEGPPLLKELIEMGFPQQTVAAVLATTNDKEKAVSILLGEPLPKQMPGEQEMQQDFEDEEENYKMVFVVRNDLKLPLHKIAECVATAALQAYRQMAAFVDVDQLKEFAFFEWTEGGQRKIVVKAPGEKELLELVELAKKKNINYALVYDLPSSFKPILQPKKPNKKESPPPVEAQLSSQKQKEDIIQIPQKQVLILGAFGPAGQSEIDPLTKHFKLL